MSDTDQPGIGTEPTAESDRRASSQPDERRSILAVNELTKIYPDGTLAVDGIDFGVLEGDFCVIIGPSGCGKSTTLHSLVGNVTPTEGTVVLDGVDITHAPTYERDIGLVFQDFQLFPHLTVEGNIRYGLERVREADEAATERVEEIIEMMKLDKLRERLPKELSAGQKQRVALARSLVLEPKLLLLDEPLGDMDYKLQKRMERELLRLHRDLDTTFVYVTHDQTQAMRLADQVIVMNDGQIEQSDTVETVYNFPATAFVAAFVGDSNLFRGTVEAADDDHVTVDTAYGSIRAGADNLDSEPDTLRGEELTFSVRPQHLSFSETTDNTLSCAVLDVLSRPGAGTQVILEATAADGSKKELQLRTWDPAPIEPGEEVTVGWNATDTILLERTSVVEGINLETTILGE